MRASLWIRLKKRLDMTVQAWRNDCRFSVILAFIRLMDDMTSRLGWKKTASFFHQKKDKWIMNFLEKKLSHVIKKYSDCKSEGTSSDNAPIWVCWWTGEETAPEIVKQCIRSIRKQSGRHEVIFITKDNYDQYITVPQYLLEKLDNKQMGLAHFADYLRVCLLEKYGGLWIDATIYCAQEIPEEYFLEPWFTCKSEYQEGKYISCFQWTTFCLGGWKQNVCYRFLKEALETYWKTEDTAIDYLFFDYIIRLGYDNVSEMKKYIQRLPVNNLHRDDLQAAMNAAESADMFFEIIKSDTVLYKLSWRETYNYRTCDNKQSIYSYFLQNKNRK